jgi:hypothetical protein
MPGTAFEAGRATGAGVVETSIGDLLMKLWLSDARWFANGVMMPESCSTLEGHAGYINVVVFSPGGHECLMRGGTFATKRMFDRSHSLVSVTASGIFSYRSPDNKMFDSIKQVAISNAATSHRPSSLFLYSSQPRCRLEKQCGDSMTHFARPNVRC